MLNIFLVFFNLLNIFNLIIFFVFKNKLFLFTDYLYFLISILL